MDSRTGELITAHQSENGVLIWTIHNPLYFKTIKEFRLTHGNQTMIEMQIRFNYNLRKELGIHKCFMNFRVWTISRPPTGLFLNVFRKQIMKYLYRLGVISINNVIRAVNHVLYDVLQTTVESEFTHNIQIKLY
ncbi:replication enhancement protein [Cotton leaf curl Gezira virus-[Cameroon]]|uniref:Replication enhancer n=1 Tax=Cotton leaf curl Gezira virus-[Cameroon] TaxID=627501 RepID=C0MHN2_9GEMI|nr:replication enhancement protein [Cotton leaf curl Gezira virus-[Cameroon]]CCG85222.1 replication enhancer protein [Cotton leaf curl Gezira virus-[Cameroon]]